jgi:hypothetical protein
VTSKYKSLIVLLLLALFSGACGSTNTDVAVIVALTQTAAVLQASAAASATVVPATATSAPAELPSPTVQPTTAPVLAPGYYPLSEDECNSLQTALTDSLGVIPAVTNPAPFNDWVNNITGTGCEMIFTGDGNSSFGGKEVFTNSGWTQAENYIAGGPGAMAIAYKKDNALCEFSSESGPADPSFCAPDMFFGECMDSLTKEQIQVTVKVSCARYQP